MMAKRFNQNQREKIRDRFYEHPYYKLCNAVFNKFYEQTPTMMMSVEDLFHDAVSILDTILTEPEKAESRCKRLWNDTYQDYRKQETSVGTEETKSEVAMLFYCIMLAMANIQDSDYRRFTSSLHLIIHKLYKDGCRSMELNLLRAVSQYNVMMRDWMSEYFICAESLTQEFNSLFKKNTNRPSTNDRRTEKYYTLKYDCTIGPNRSYRIDVVRKKLEDWNWIKKNTDVEDFEHFFDGQPRDCNIQWAGPNITILTMLIDRLRKQSYMNHYTGCSTRSIVTKQFHETPNRNFERLTDVDLSRIELIVLILDYNIPLDLPKQPGSNIEDTTDAALQEVLSGHLHITKDLRKTYGIETG